MSYVRCLLCVAELKYHGNTSSMIRHYASKHGSTLNQGEINKVDEKPDLDEDLVNMLVKEPEPFSIVDALLLNDTEEPPRKKVRSDMWEYFKHISPDQVRCSLCSAVLKYHQNTSSMVRHYTTKHGGPVNQGKTNKDRKRVLDEALVNMLVKDSQPFSIVDDSGFKEFVALLDPTYTLPSKQALKQMVIQRYGGQKNTIKGHAEDEDSDTDC